MSKESELSKICLYYQTFMEEAYGTEELQKPALKACAMQNLIIAEKGIVISLDSVAHFEEQLFEIKKNMEAAMDHYMDKPALPSEVIEILQLYKQDIVWAVSSDELMRIVHKTIDLTAPQSTDRA